MRRSLEADHRHRRAAQPLLLQGTALVMTLVTLALILIAGWLSVAG